MITTNTILVFTLTFLPTICRKLPGGCVFKHNVLPHIKCISELSARKINKHKETQTQSYHFKMIFLKGLKISFVEHRRDFLLSSIPGPCSFLPTGRQDCTCLGGTQVFTQRQFPWIFLLWTQNRRYSDTASSMLKTV